MCARVGWFCVCARILLCAIICVWGAYLPTSVRMVAKYDVDRFAFLGGLSLFYHQIMYMYDIFAVWD